MNYLQDTDDQISSSNKTLSLSIILLAFKEWVELYLHSPVHLHGMVLS